MNPPLDLDFFDTFEMKVSGSPFNDFTLRLD